MAPVYVKGGIWTNVEDEILKLSISKYGLNQWARVSSLVPKKTAKQCKARWNEWLDPRIRKIEWSKEEDEKLLRLVKLMPNQWRSIGPIVGRTPTQCIERYQKLLDEANKEGGDDDAGDSELGLKGSGIELLAAAGKSVRIGDIHLNPESKPARPDEEEMDDEEKEMLSEARARLANTLGKKAKRKARERMLDESRKISLLQKRRELKNAGINMKLKKHKKGDDKRIDYNLEIPVEMQPPPGLFSTEEEDRRNRNQERQFQQEVSKNGTNNIEFEKQQKKEKRKNREPVVERGEQLVEELDSGFKRRKLVMPEPIAGDSGRRSQGEDGSDLISRALSVDVDVEKPSVVSGHKLEGILDQVRGIQLRSEQQSSLLGEDYSSRDVEMEESEQEEPENEPEEEDDDFDNFEEDFDSRPIDIKSRLAALSEAKADYDWIEEAQQTDEEEQEQEEQLPTSTRAETVDQGELLRLENLRKQLELEKALLRRSQVLQRQLPVPDISELDESVLSRLVSRKGLSEVNKLISLELASLIRSDYAKSTDSVDDPNVIADLDEESFAHVHDQIEQEIKSCNVSLEQFQKLIEPEIVLVTEGLPALDTKVVASNEQIQGLVEELKSTALNSFKLEKKFLLFNSGYLKRYDSLVKRFHELQKETIEADLHLKTYAEIEKMELIAIENRSNVLQESVERLVNAESVGQRRYDELTGRLG